MWLDPDSVTKLPGIDAMGPMQRRRSRPLQAEPKRSRRAAWRATETPRSRVTVESMVTDDSQGSIVSLTNRSMWLFSWAMPSLALRS